MLFSRYRCRAYENFVFLICCIFVLLVLRHLAAVRFHVSHGREEIPRSKHGISSFKFSGHGTVFDFVLLQGYRTGALAFVAVGMSPVSRGDPQLTGCRWYDFNGLFVTGSLTISHSGDHHRRPYQAINLHCTFPSGSNTSQGGKLIMTLNSYNIDVYKEDSPPSKLEPAAPYKHEITFCSSGIYGDVSAPRIYEWLEFHCRVGIDHFIMYDLGGVDELVFKVLEKYVKRGVMEIFNVTSLLEFDAWERGQLALMNDCVYKTRYSTKWVLFMDFNEYLHISGPRSSLPDFLARHASMPYVTFGSLWWSMHMCGNTSLEESWPMERLVFRRRHFYCVGDSPKELCIDWPGYRKLAVNPRLVLAMQLHNPNVPQGGGVHINADEARMNHFQGLLGMTDRIRCQGEPATGDDHDEWFHSDEVALFSHEARMHPLISRVDALGRHQL